MQVIPAITQVSSHVCRCCCICQTICWWKFQYSPGNHFQRSLLVSVVFTVLCCWKSFIILVIGLENVLGCCWFYSRADKWRSSHIWPVLSLFLPTKGISWTYDTTLSACCPWYKMKSNTGSISQHSWFVRMALNNVRGRATEIVLASRKPQNSHWK